MYKPYKTDKDVYVFDSKGNKLCRTDFVLDTEDDIATFQKECAKYPAGTTGYVASTKKVLMLNCQGVFV